MPIMKPETPESTMMIDDKQLDEQELLAAESLTQMRTPHIQIVYFQQGMNQTQK